MPKMNPDLQKVDPHFMQIVLSLQAAAMQYMGKVLNPMTSKIERDLMMAQNSIDMLTMLEKKTKNNLSEDEAKMIEHVLYELRLNFVDESKKEEPQVDVSENAKIDENNESKEK